MAVPQRFTIRYQILGHAAMAINLLVLTGCSRSAYHLAGVSGVVTLDGEPLADARVAFQPRRVGEGLDSGPGSYGTTNSHGQYTLRTINGAGGAVVATHGVRISTFLADADQTFESPRIIAPERVPVRYQQPDVLTFTVPPDGTTTGDFHLSTKE